MSNKKEIIELSPSPHSGREMFKIGGFVCPYCNGRKVFTCETGRDTVETEICTYCQGAGCVEAIVSIEWKPQKV